MELAKKAEPKMEGDVKVKVVRGLCVRGVRSFFGLGMDWLCVIFVTRANTGRTVHSPHLTGDWCSREGSTNIVKKPWQRCSACRLADGGRCGWASPQTLIGSPPSHRTQIQNTFVVAAFEEVELSQHRRSVDNGKFMTTGPPFLKRELDAASKFQGGVLVRGAFLDRI